MIPYKNIEKAIEYILGVLTENEEVKKFPQDFVTASAQWVRSWFLKDDPMSSLILEDKNQSMPVKKAVLDAKLNLLMPNQQFVQELEQHLQTYQQHQLRIKNVIDQSSQVSAGGNVVIGDTGPASHDQYDEKNAIKGGSSVHAGGNVRLGDDVISNNQQVNIHHYYNTPPKPSGAHPNPTDMPPPGFVASLHNLIGQAKTERAIAQLKEYAEKDHPDILPELVQLSSRLQENAKRERLNIVTNAEGSAERSKITFALLEMIKLLES